MIEEISTEESRIETRLVFGSGSVRTSRGTPVILAQTLRYLLQNPKESVGLLSRLGHDRFLPNSLNYTIHLLSCPRTVQSWY
jgi:hypothetical protein